MCVRELLAAWGFHDLGPLWVCLEGESCFPLRSPSPFWDKMLLGT